MFKNAITVTENTIWNNILFISPYFKYLINVRTKKYKNYSFVSFFAALNEKLGKI